ncbi:MULTISPECIES: putative phage tail assembly chaperone [unclassified Pseudomonas]|uniref:putative phage tail assembly chaperone n=1 Tax=unclassified Pseudomonas TaxID=196821 RepID=UPI00249F72EF|nr:putative phage tail assembly chaperone [Pseudomonas sp. V88_4]MDI3398714.1 putative phage tail assembly chaperone [Pseudomonas sp. V88_4]
MSQQNTEITLEVGENEFTFNLTPADVTKYFNALTQTNKVAPGNNLLMTTVLQDQKTVLKPLLGNPVMVMQLAGALLEEYAPNVEVIVKKRSSTLSA